MQGLLLSQQEGQDSIILEEGGYKRDRQQLPKSVSTHVGRGRGNLG